METNINELIKIISILLKKEPYEINKLYFENKIDKKIIKKSKSILEKKKKGKDITFDLKTKYFFNSYLEIRKKVFVPQFDTEGLIPIVIENISKDKKGLEVGAGTGAISIALSKLGYKMKSIDISRKAINLSKKNAFLNKVEIDFKKQNIFNFQPQEKYDFLISNPPYIKYGDKEVEKWVKKNQPKKALYSKNNGLLFYEFLIKNINKYVNENGFLFFEIGHNQKKEIQGFLEHKKYNFLEDINGLERYLVIQNVQVN